MPADRTQRGARASARAAAEAARAARAHLHRSTRWNGLRRGDAVDVACPWGRSGRWRFEAHVSNQRNGEEWVEVTGGPPGALQVRSCRPEEVLPPGGRRGGEPSLADAPRLPFEA